MPNIFWGSHAPQKGPPLFGGAGGGPLAPPLAAKPARAPLPRGESAPESQNEGFYPLASFLFPKNQKESGDLIQQFAFIFSQINFLIFPSRPLLEFIFLIQV